MPTYDYECKKCESIFEAFQKMSDAHLTECPSCGGEVRRLLGAGAGLIFKGGGFYETDYRNSGYKAAAAKDSSAASCPSGGDCSKCEKA
jgi:putative FmdB family regulatory protein